MSIPYVQSGNVLKLPELFPENYFKFTMGSPPYLTARDYGRDDIALTLEPWVQFMIASTKAALQVTNGIVLWVCAGVGSEKYQPGPECLIADLTRHCESWCEVLRPAIWAKNAPPTGSKWFSNDWEYCLALTKPGAERTWNPEALEELLKYTNGGSFRQRRKDGTRSAGSAYPTHRYRKRPSNVTWADFDHQADDKWDGNLHYVPVGGGLLGWKDSHLNEAPYPENLVSRFLKTVTNPGDTVLDPFCGSGTTVDVSFQLGRVGYGVDIRDSQSDLTKRRLREMHNIVVP